ncbi:hypothetical protein KBK19_18920 [Microvirga sp. STR05]|uniref:Uncharacterized protein n=1 Tax=Hymenobacter duratus TaxID=2771356 RepID=A0ABR8JND0_9BACT|nr:hypothetical protein [Hymenobacter duratus]MBD2717123.1 hypothetical protein [Hymenobacter duratus]MBR7952039.1 hypothetical protein [Microvirga sp. STR05]
MRRFSLAVSAAAPRPLTRSVALAGLLLALAATASPAQAQHASPVSVTSPDAESIRVRINQAARQPGRVQVVSLGSGQVLFDEAYDAPAYGHRFNFRTLPAGRYALLLHAASTHYRYTLQVQPGPTGQTVAVRQLKVREPQQLLAGAQ